MLKDEFTGNNTHKFQKDLLAGLTVAAVALPLAQTVGVASSEASAAAGLVTAIIEDLLIGYPLPTIPDNHYQNLWHRH